MKNIVINVGDKVIDSYGLCGEVIHICNCSHCRIRGFYEPTVKWENGVETSITCYDKENEFNDFYQIGKHLFPSHLVEIEEIDEMIIAEKEELEEVLARVKQLEKQKEKLQELKKLG